MHATDPHNRFQPNREPDRLPRQIQPLGYELQQAPEARTHEPETNRSASFNIPRSFGRSDLSEVEAELTGKVADLRQRGLASPAL